MKQLFSFAKKEMRHILRDTRTTVILLIMPIVLLLILGYAVSTEIKNTPVIVLDQSKTQISSQLIQKIDGNVFFSVIGFVNNNQQMEDYFKKGKIKIGLVIPENFTQDLYSEKGTNIQVIIDASDPSEATNINNYLQSIILDFQQNAFKSQNITALINPEFRLQYNPQALSAYSIVPGLMGVILLMICAMMTSVAIVKEKESGTMEILLVSPLKPLDIVIGKAIPYFIISMINAVTILILANFLMGVPVRGNIFLILFLCVIYNLASLSLGLLISTITKTQELAVLISLVGLMLPSIILSGLIFPIESAPQILQTIGYIIPARWFVVAMRNIMIKGQGIESVWMELSVLSGMTIFLIFISTKLFKQRL